MAYEPARRTATALQERDALSQTGGTVRRGIGQAKIPAYFFNRDCQFVITVSGGLLG